MLGHEDEFHDVQEESEMANSGSGGDEVIVVDSDGEYPKHIAKKKEILLYVREKDKQYSFTKKEMKNMNRRCSLLSDCLPVTVLHLF
jgi:hypothetical protein